MLQILHKETFQALCHTRAVNDRVHLKIQLKAPDIHVRSPIAAHQPVHHHTLRVQKPIIVGIAFGACFQQIPDIGIGRPVDKGVIRLARNHDTHIHA